MHEKMTDEALHRMKARHESRLMSADEAKMWAHIAALTSERDLAMTQRDAKEGDVLRWERSAADMRNERDALRERVKALEAHDRETRRANTWRERADAAESRLAAMRQRAEDADMLEEKAQAAYSECGMGAVVMRRVSLAVARHILGDDASAPSEMSGLEGEMADTSDMERADYKAPPARDALETPTPPAPTTSEAFAATCRPLAVVAHGGGISTDDAHRALAALSLLERRMGAQEAAIRRLIRDAERQDSMPETTNEHGERMVRVQWVLVESLRAALTDAPPVFTLEEIREALGRGSTVDEVVAILTALRR